MRPTIQRMDNEISQTVPNFLISQNIALLELTPAHVHRRNAAEQAIRTWKNHFLAGLASLNPLFPIRFWSHLLPESEMTLNLLRQSRINPKLSAYAQLNGNFDFNRTPMAPPGCEVIAFTPLTHQPSWQYQEYKAWYVKPSMDHYRCVKDLNETTGREATVETVQCLPHNFAMPAMSSHNLAVKAAYDLTKALQKPHPATPFLLPNTAQVEALHNLAKIFTEMANPKPTDVITPVLSPRVLPAERPEANQTVLLRLPENNDVIIPTDDTPLQYINAVLNPTTGLDLEYRHLIRHPTYRGTRLKSAANEFRR